MSVLSACYLTSYRAVVWTWCPVVGQTQISLHMSYS